MLLNENILSSKLSMNWPAGELIAPSSPKVQTRRVISIVIIARNEERTIGECVSNAVQSLELAVRQGRAEQGEVILVDSASLDATARRAMEFPVTVYQLPAEWPQSASAARQTGFEQSKGDVVYFIDGDTVVEPGWLTEGLGLIDRPGVAGVCGLVLEAQDGKTLLAKEIHRVTMKDAQIQEPTEVEVAPVGLYRREILDAVGGFQPFLKGAEDLDLAFRIRLLGLRILRTPSIMARHHWSSDQHDVRFVDYFRSVASWSYGSGQACRDHFANQELRGMFVKRYVTARFLIEYFKALILSALVLAHAEAVLTFPIALGPLVAMDVCLVIATDRLRKRTNRTWGEIVLPLHGIVYAVVRHGGFFLGLLKRLESPTKYPKGPRVLQEGFMWRAGVLNGVLLEPRRGSKRVT